MVLRFVLVSLVASLGFELPQNADLSRWIDSSRTWLSAQLETPHIVGDDVIEVVEEDPNTPSPAVNADVAALDLQETLSESARRPGDALSIEVVELEDEPTAVEPELVVAQDVPDPDAAFESVVRDMSASFSAESLAPDPVQIAEVETPNEVEPVDLLKFEEFVDVEQVAATHAPEIVPEPEPSRSDRLGMAVNLTGQALQAWIGVLQQTTPIASAR